jgi:CO/xanthine dehydrogenase FAD-binding subunit
LYNKGETMSISIWNTSYTPQAIVAPILTQAQYDQLCPSGVPTEVGRTVVDNQLASAEHEIVNREFTLLSNTAGWTGGIANQNRGTIGGNIVNASPAADSLPALLVYEAELILVSARGERRVPYSSFHTAYRKTKLAPDELVLAVCLQRRFSGYHAHARKVGARNAQAISKVCLAALGRMADGVVEDIRLAMGSVAPVPMRLGETERIIKGKRIDLPLVQLARKTAAAEIRPIDDIRSSARYRAAVAGNLVAEFLDELNASGTKT